MYIVGPKAETVEAPVKLYLSGKLLPWVEHCNHLGHTLTVEGTFKKDTQEKRATFIDSSVKIREALHIAQPPEVITATLKNCSAFYGSPLWDLQSKETENIFSAWKTSVKLTWNLPRATHSYFLPLLAPKMLSIRSSLLARFHKFFRSLLESSSHEVQVVALLAARDIRSNLGSNLRIILDETGLDPWTATSAEVKSALLYREVQLYTPPEADMWRVPYLWKLLDAKQRDHYLADSNEKSQLDQLINSLVIN